MKIFKVWDYTNESWVEDNINDYINFNWTMPGYKKAGESFIDVRHGVSAEIVWQDNDGNFVLP